MAVYEDDRENSMLPAELLNDEGEYTGAFDPWFEQGLLDIMYSESHTRILRFVISDSYALRFTAAVFEFLIKESEEIPLEKVEFVYKLDANRIKPLSLRDVAVDYFYSASKTECWDIDEKEIQCTVDLNWNDLSVVYANTLNWLDRLDRHQFATAGSAGTIWKDKTSANLQEYLSNPTASQHEMMIEWQENFTFRDTRVLILNKNESLPALSA